MTGQSVHKEDQIPLVADLDQIPDAQDTDDERDDVRAKSPRVMVGDHAAERHLAVFDRNLDISRIDPIVGGQRFADRLANVVIRWLVPQWPLSTLTVPVELFVDIDASRVKH